MSDAASCVNRTGATCLPLITEPSNTADLRRFHRRRRRTSSCPCSQSPQLQSELPWVILRPGGVVSALPQFGIDRQLLQFERMLPTDGRIQTVDIRDVASAFIADGTVNSPRNSARPWVFPVSQCQDCRETHTTIRRGFRPTGWSAHAPRAFSRARITRGRKCWPS